LDNPNVVVFDTASMEDKFNV